MFDPCSWYESLDKYMSRVCVVCYKLQNQILYKKNYPTKNYSSAEPLSEYYVLITACVTRPLTSRTCLTVKDLILMYFIFYTS